MKLLSNLKKRYGKLSLITQLALITAIMMTAAIGLVISYSYVRNIHTINEQQMFTESSLLSLENQNMDTYFEQLDSFSLQIRNDDKAVQLLNSRKPLSYSDQSYLQNLVRTSFFSRSDLFSLRLYLPNQNIYYEISSFVPNIHTGTFSSLDRIPGFHECIQGPHYKAMIPPVNTGYLMTYYRAIINIETNYPIGIVVLTLKTSYIENLTKSHSEQEEIFCLLDEKNRLFFSNDMRIQSSHIEQIENNISTAPCSFHAEIDGLEYLIVYHVSPTTGWKLVSFKPQYLIDKQVNETRNGSLLIAFISIPLSVTLVIFLIRVVTKPLSALAHRLRRVGNGNFKTTTNIHGCAEIDNLAKSFNMMIKRIDELIEKNYISELNEKTARLIALEAQLNPHFLYNTLQAISAEAIVNGQPQINRMVTALASLLRYSIKEDVFVFLEQEIKHVMDYLLLQKARYDERLTYDIEVDENTLQLMIPKISIQSLVENSVIHGMENNLHSIHLHIKACIVSESNLVITVTDNGSGVSSEKLEALRKELEIENIPHHCNTGIGLKNLASRLRILYNKKADISITSTPFQNTTVTVTIPICKEESHDV